MIPFEDITSAEGAIEAILRDDLYLPHGLMLPRLRNAAKEGATVKGVHCPGGAIGVLVPCGTIEAPRLGAMLFVREELRGEGIGLAIVKALKNLAGNYPVHFFPHDYRSARLFKRALDTRTLTVADFEFVALVLMNQCLGDKTRQAAAPAHVSSRHRDRTLIKLKPSV